MINEFGEPLAEVEARKAAVERNRAAMDKAPLAHQLEIANLAILWQQEALLQVLAAFNGTANPHPQVIIHRAKYAERSAEMYFDEFSVNREKYATLDEAMALAVARANASCELCAGVESVNGSSCVLCDLRRRLIMG